jgi:hypothetical protein
VLDDLDFEFEFERVVKFKVKLKFKLEFELHFESPSLLIRKTPLSHGLLTHNRAERFLKICFIIGFGLGTISVSTEIVLGNRYGSVGTTEIENRNFGFFFFAFPARLQRRIRLLYPSKRLPCDPERVLHGPGGDTDLDVVDGRRYYQWHRMSWWRRTVIGRLEQCHLPSARNRPSASETCVIACMMPDSELSGRVHSYNSNV